jgi:hypothetical protein
LVYDNFYQNGLFALMIMEPSDTEDDMAARIPDSWTGEWIPRQCRCTTILTKEQPMNASEMTDEEAKDKCIEKWEWIIKNMDKFKSPADAENFYANHIAENSSAHGCAYCHKYYNVYGNCDKCPLYLKGNGRCGVEGDSLWGKWFRDPCEETARAMLEAVKHSLDEDLPEVEDCICGEKYKLNYASDIGGSHGEKLFVGNSFVQCYACHKRGPQKSAIKERINAWNEMIRKEKAGKKCCSTDYGNLYKYCPHCGKKL